MNHPTGKQSGSVSASSVDARFRRSKVAGSFGEEFADRVREKWRGGQRGALMTAA
jgi:hypothetical protein